MTEGSLVIVDIGDPVLIEKVLDLVDSCTRVLLTLPCPFHGELSSQLKTKRLVTFYELSALSNLQVTQRLVYAIQCCHDLTPGEKERNALSYLSSMCCGYPAITDVMSSFIDKCIIKLNEDPCEGIKYAKNKFLTVLGDIIDSTNDKISKPRVVMLTLVQCLKEEGFLSTQSQLLLHCLTLFGPLPIPQCALVAISEEIIDSCSIKSHLPTEVWDTLCSLNLLKQYPSISSSSCSSDFITKLFYVPADWLCSEIVVDRKKSTVCGYLIHCGFKRLVADFFSSQVPLTDSIYVLELLRSIQKFLPLQEELTDNITLLQAFTTKLCAEWLIGINCPSWST